VRQKIISFLLAGTILTIGRGVFSAPFLSAYDRVMVAVYTHDDDLLEEMVASGVNVNALNPSGQTPLCTTLRNQDVKAYEMLVSKGASVFVPCVNQIHPNVLSSFYGENPQFGQYVGGRIIPPVVEQSSSASLLVGVPWPHVGEVLLAGVTAGAVIIGNNSSSDKEEEPSAPESNLNYNPVDTGMTDSYYRDLGPYFKNREYFKDKATAQDFLDHYENKDWDMAMDYVKEYNSSEGWIVQINDPEYQYSTINPMRFLPMIDAGSAYVRGYTGFVVDRTDPEKPYKTNEKVKVAVLDTGLEIGDYAHSELKENISSTRLNFAYGPCTSANNAKCWEYDVSTGKAYLNDSTSSGIKMTLGEWNRYAMAFAPICSATGQKNCLTESNPLNDTYEITYYPESGTQIQVVVPEDVWQEYKDKYGTTGYIYDENDPTPAILFVNESKSDANHGSHVTGIIAAVQDGKVMSGVAPNAEIIPVRADLVMGQSLNHLKEVVDTDARVINLSLGTDSYYIDNDATYNKYFWNLFDSDIKDGYQAAADNNTVLVFAAGNEAKSQPHIYTVAPLIGDSNDNRQNYANSIYKNLLISVVALGENKKLAPYSNSCGASSMYCLSAPGGNIDEGNPMISTSIGNEYLGMEGTSMATPVVSGSVALLMGAFPFLTSQQVVQILFETADYIEPEATEIDDYNKKASAEGLSSTYADMTKEGEYNAIYGHGLVNLNAATDPIGLQSIGFDTVASSKNTFSVKNTSLTIPNKMGHTLDKLPNKIIVLDKYTRPYAFATSGFIKTKKTSDALKRSFQSFMAFDEKQIKSSDNISFAFTSTPSDSVGLPVGSLSMQLNPSSDVHLRMGYSQDTRSFSNTYTERLIQNPFFNMRQAWGADVSWDMSQKLALIAGFKYGQNGFIDSEVLENMEHKPMVYAIHTGLRYAPKKSVVFDVSFGQMNEEDSLMGMDGQGAFDTDGNKTHFVSFATHINPIDKFKLSASYTYGMTEANDTRSLMQFSRLTSDAFAMTLSYTPDEQSLYGFKVASPLRVRSGTVSFDLPTGRDMYADKLYRTQYVSSMKPEAREYDLSLFFMNQLKEQLSLAGEMGVRLNPDHQKQQPDWRTLFKMNWNW